MDGTWYKDIGIAGWAYVHVGAGELVNFEFGSLKQENMKISNVDAELVATMKALEYAKRMGFRKVEIRYDYEGIRSFAKGLWKPKCWITCKYVEAVKDSGIQIVFTKVNKRDKMNLAVNALARGDVISMFFYASQSLIKINHDKSNTDLTHSSSRV